MWRSGLQGDSRRAAPPPQHLWGGSWKPSPRVPNCFHSSTAFIDKHSFLYLLPSLVRAEEMFGDDWRSCSHPEPCTLQGKPVTPEHGCLTAWQQLSMACGGFIRGCQRVSMTESTSYLQAPQFIFQCLSQWFVIMCQIANPSGRGPGRVPFLPTVSSGGGTGKLLWAQPCQPNPETAVPTFLSSVW